MLQMDLFVLEKRCITLTNKLWRILSEPLEEAMRPSKTWTNQYNGNATLSQVAVKTSIVTDGILNLIMIWLVTRQVHGTSLRQVLGLNRL